MVERDPQRQPLDGKRGQAEKSVGHLHHRPHCIGQHEDAIAAGEAFPEHRREFRVHEGLAAREADFLGVRPARRRVVEPCAQIGEGQPCEAVIARAGFDVTGLAGEIAERARVEPQGAQRSEGHPRPRGACRRHPSGSRNFAGSSARSAASVAGGMGRELLGGQCDGECEHYGREAACQATARPWRGKGVTDPGLPSVRRGFRLSPLAGVVQW